MVLHSAFLNCRELIDIRLVSPRSTVFGAFGGQFGGQNRGRIRVAARSVLPLANHALMMRNSSAAAFSAAARFKTLREGTGETNCLCGPCGAARRRTAMR